MNKAGGFITLHRKMTDWEWYKDINTKVLFLHLLLTANFTDTRFLGKKIKRGQLVTSLASMAEETGLSVQNVKTALKHLISTNEITNVSTQNYRIITVVKYDEYQSLTNEVTNDQQSANKALTKRQQHHNNDNNVNKGTIIRESEREKPQPKRFIKPTREECIAYAHERGDKIDGEYFFDYYEANGWEMQNWKAKMRTWEKREEKYRNGSSGKSGSPGNHKETAGKAKTDYSIFSAGVLQL